MRIQKLCDASFLKVERYLENDLLRYCDVLLLRVTYIRGLVLADDVYEEELDLSADALQDLIDGIVVWILLQRI